VHLSIPTKKLEDVVKEAEAFGATLGKEYVGPQIARSNHSYSPQNSKTKNSIDMCIYIDIDRKRST
jgi:hypothetical protein